MGDQQNATDVLNRLQERIQCIREGGRVQPSTRTLIFDAQEPGTTDDQNYIAAAFDDVYLLLAKLLIDDTTATEALKMRRILGRFVNAYANVDRKSAGEVEAAIFRCWLEAASVLGIKPQKFDAQGGRTHPKEDRR